MKTRLLIATWMLAILGTAHAAILPGYYSAPGMDTNRDYLNQHFNEHIDPFTGKLQLHYTDLVIPGNGGLDLVVQRSYTTLEFTQRENSDLTLLGARTPWGIGWTMHFGRVISTNSNACTRSSLTEMTDNPVLELPDGSRQILFDAQTTNPSGPLYLTTERWKADCANDGSLGLKVTSSDGTIYDMTVRELRPMGTFTQYSWYVSRITDRNGNTMTFTYVTNPANYVLLKSISTSDGRSVTFTYTDENTPDARLTSISSGTRTWTYAYTPAPGLPFRYFLTQVTRPSGGRWLYEYNGNLGTTTAGSYSLSRLTYPTNGTINYTYGFTQFDLADPFNDAVTVATKVADGGTWTFTYAPGTGYDQTTVNTPIGTLTYRHVGYSAATNGTVWQIGLPLRKTVGSIQTETFTWGSQVISDENLRRSEIFTIKQDTDSRAPILTGQTITRDGTNYTTTHSNFDTFGNPQRRVENGNVTKTTDFTYLVDTTKWIVHQLKNETIAGIGTIDRTFNANGDMTREIRYGVTTNYTYTATGDLSTVRDARLNTTTYSSYSRGVARTEQRPESVTITRTVDGFGNILSVTDGEGHRTDYTYDGINRLTSINFPIGDTANINWGTTSRTVTRGTYSETTNFDGFARPTGITREGITTTATYNRLGQRTFESYPGSTTGTTFTWDMLDRMTRATHPDGSFKRFSYLSGNQSSVINERNFTTTYTYRSFGDPNERELMQITAPVAAANVTIARNLLGQLTSATQNGKTRSYGYDTRFYLTSITHPETGTTVLGRDAVGNKTSRQVGTSGTVTYGYDGLNRLTTITYPAGTQSVTQTWDRNNQLKSVSNGIIRDYSYDANGNLTNETLTFGTLTFPVSYAINSLDHVQSITYPSGRVVTYAPNDLGRPTQVMPYAASVTHHPSGQVGSINFSNGVASTMALNDRLWPTTLSAVGTASLLNVTYDHDDAGNVTSITDAVVASNNRTLGYDAIDRLTSASGSWGSGAIAYDGDGDITSQTRGSNTTSYTYDSTNNRLTGVSSTPTVNVVGVTITANSIPAGTYTVVVETASPHNLQRHHVVNVSGMNATGNYDLDGVRSVASIIDATRFRVANNFTKPPTGSYVSGGALSRGYAFTYDAYGNVTSDGARTFSYDNAPVMTCANCSFDPVSYLYDGRNTLVRMRRGQVITNYRLYALNGDLLGEYGSSGQPNIEYAYLYGQLVATYSSTGNVTTTYHVDPSGSPIAATNQAGTVLWRESYLPYGERMSNLASSGGALGFGGEFQERTTGLSDFGARHYDPFIGRYLAIDAEEFAGDGIQGFNRYNYANNNPYRFVDPDGNSALTKAIKFVIKGGDVAATFADAMQDVNTVFDSKATTWQRIVAGASLLSELAPVSASDFKDVGRILSAIKGPGKGTARATDHVGSLPKPPTGPGSVPKADRDPKRVWTSSERATKRDSQSGKCGTGCGTDIDASNSRGHHIKRHADGGKTIPENHSEVCLTCHDKLHSP